MEVMNPTMKIKALAARLGISEKTIKKLEKLGELPKPKRDGWGCRIYAEDDLAELERKVAAYQGRLRKQNNIGE